MQPRLLIILSCHSAQEVLHFGGGGCRNSVHEYGSPLPTISPGTPCLEVQISKGWEQGSCSFQTWHLYSYIAVQMPGLKAAASLLPSFANLDFKAGGPRGDCWEGASIFMYRIPTASSSKMQNLLCRMTAENNQEARLH